MRYDREIKLPLYAKHAIPDVWIVDLEGLQLHCMRKPAGEKYESVDDLSADACIEVTLLPGIRLDLAELFA